MPELYPTDPPPRRELLTALAARLHQVVPDFRPVAEDLLADVSRIDVFGVAGDGSPVLALLGDAGDDLTLVARALAQCEWLAPRLDDWRKLAPDLDVRAGAPVQAIVLCPEFGPEARAVVRALEPGRVRLVAWRYLRNGGGSGLLLEQISAAAASPTPTARRQPSGFRTGLSDADLGLSDEERAEFE